jgi:DNA-binding CsgD family transcriptional regulator
MGAFCMGDPNAQKRKCKVVRWEGTWPAAVYDHYACLNLFSVDPTVARLTRDPKPFRWSDSYKTAGAQGRRALDELMALGGRDGLAVPIHGPTGPVAGISIGTNHYELSPNDERALHMASLYLHARLATLRRESGAGRKRALTPRERECLKWVAAGKTDWEISQILNISEQTAHGYVQNALAKQGARTRAQAVALAILSAQIAL